MERKVKIVIECNEYSVPKSMNDKLIDYQCSGEYEAFNELLFMIKDNYEVKRRVTNIYYFQ